MFRIDVFTMFRIDLVTMFPKVSLCFWDLATFDQQLPALSRLQGRLFVFDRRNSVPVGEGAKRSAVRGAPDLGIGKLVKLGKKHGES